ncbi:MAG: DUF1572 family protein, partial [Candidatus Bathyarchaeia archaeon]
MSENVAAIYLKDMRKQLRSLKTLADRALAQVKDEEYPVEIDEESNSITILMKHVSGNMTTLWTRPLAPAEEWPTRYRDLEFTLTDEDTRDAITKRWDKAWNGLYKTLDGLTAENLLGTMTVRGNDSTLMEVLNGQYRHYAVHVGQIVFLAKHFRVANWDSLSVP